QGDLEVLLLPAARLAGGQHRLAEVLAGGAGHHQLRAGLARLRREANVVKHGLAGAAAPGAGHRALLGFAPAKRVDVDRALVRGVVRLARDPVEFQEVILRGHCLPPVRVVRSCSASPGWWWAFGLVSCHLLPTLA